MLGVMSIRHSETALQGLSPVFVLPRHVKHALLQRQNATTNVPVNAASNEASLVDWTYLGLSHALLGLPT